MRGDGLHRLAIVVVHLELFLLIEFLLGRISGLAAGDDAIVKNPLAEHLAQVGVFADALGDDVARAFESCFNGGDAFFFIDEGRGKCCERCFTRLLLP